MTNKPLQYILLQDQIYLESPFILLRKGSVCTYEPPLPGQEPICAFPLQEHIIPHYRLYTIKNNPHIFQPVHDISYATKIYNDILIADKAYSSNQQIDLAQFKTDMIRASQIIHSAEIPKSLVKPALLFLILQELKEKQS